MASTGGVTGPVPPKRPTVIRPTHGPPVPNRPAPPTHTRKIDSSADKEQKQLPPPPPARPEVKTRPSSVINKSHQPSSSQTTNSNGGKRRPEITIVSARPMSEIGFRNVQATESKQLEDESSKSEEQIKNVPPPLPSARPHVKLDSLDQKPNQVPLRPTVIRPTVPPLAYKPDSDSTVENTKQPARTPPPIPRLPPSPLLKREGNDSQKSTTVPNVAPVPNPRNTAIKHEPSSDAVVDDLIDISIDSKSENRTTEAALYSMIKKPTRPTIIRPNRPPVRDKSNQDHVVDDSSSPIIPLVPQKVLPSPLTEQKDKQTGEGHDSADGDVLQARKSFFENKQDNVVPEFLTKRLKPTIPTEADTNDEQHPNQSKKPLPPPTKPKPSIPIQIKPPPLPVKPRSPVINESHDTDKKTVGETVNKPPSPMLKPKPRSPRTDTDKQESQSSPSSPGNKPSPPPAKLKPTIFSQFEKGSQEEGNENLNKPIVPATKPKPTIIPKPQVSTKPQSPKHHNEAESFPTVGDNVSEVISEKDDTKSKSVNEIVKPPSMKRPTIIRPLRGVQSKSSENISQDDQHSITPDIEEQSYDDHLNKTSSHPQPPLPNKRPVSMVNIPDTLAQEEKRDESMSRSYHLKTQSTENISNSPPSPKPGPRPTARPRPASMMIPQTGRPPLPSSGPKVQSADTDLHNPPQRPPQRPPGSRMSTIGIPVFPKLDNNVQQEAESSDSKSSGPVKPPAPRKVSKDERDSSSEEEFYTAQTKPDRPTGPPKPRTRTHSDDTPSSDTSPDKKPPPRPAGAPPPGRKTSINTENDDTHVFTTRGKPDRPGSKPSRPTSTPPKMDQPMRPQPPRPRGPQSARRANGPDLPSRPGPSHPLYSYMMKAPHAVAVFDYSARQEDELQFKTGDVIILKKVVDADWLVGQVGDNEGIFPKGFVRVKIPLPGQEADSGDSSDEEEIYFDATAEKPDTIGVGPRCRARFDFDGDGVDDLPFEEGDIIKLVERVGPEWRKGECKGRVGVFPLVFVEVIEDLPEDTEPQKKSTTVKAMFDFDGEDNELSFQAGECIQVQYMVNEEWLYGVIGKRSGQFPVQFIDHVPSELPPMPQKEHKENRPADPLTTSLAMWDTPNQSIKVDSPKSHDVAVTHGAPHGQVDDTLVKNEISEQESLSRHENDDKPYCVAVYDYPGETAEDLKFDVGDRIDLLDRVNSDWLKGACHGQTGIFPSAFVEIKVDLKEDSFQTKNAQPSALNLTEWDLPSAPSHTEIGVAQYDFTGESDNELTFIAGDRIQLLEHVTGAEDWRNGILNGRQGIFPAAFVISEN